MNAVQPARRGAAAVSQTVDPHLAPQPELVIASACFERPVVDAGSEHALAPVVDAGSEHALAQLAQLQAQADRRVWFCGAYAQAGIPLLESAVRSARTVAQRLAGLQSDGMPGAQD